MTKQSKTKKPDYETLAATYQVAETALLNSVLKACGISDKRKRRKICEDFIFSQGVIFDQGAFQEDGKWFAPVLGYTELQGSPDKGFQKKQNLQTPPSDFTGYHEYAFGNMDYFFVESKEKTDFEWGPKYES